MDKRSETSSRSSRSDRPVDGPAASDRPASDRRKHRTRRQLKDALFSLILEKGYDAVTVEDITDRADLGRTTFYLHYHDKEELLLESIDSISEELMAQIAPIPPSSWNALPGQNEANPRDPIRVVFRHAAANGPLYLIILRGEGATRTSQRVRAIISQKVIEVLHASVESGAAIHPRVPEEVFAGYLAGALMGMITWWLESSTPYTPDEMAEIFRSLFFQGGRKILGLED